MKLIKYKILGNKAAFQVEAPLFEVIIRCETQEVLNATLPGVLEDAYNGEYTIEDDGVPDQQEMPTQLDRIEAQVTYTAMMTDTLLEA
jgi:hypothetical protein